MLRSLNIRSKLLLTVLVPLLALITVAAIVFPTFQTVKIGGSEYKKIAQLQELRADVHPPPLFLVESHLLVGNLLSLLDTSKMNEAHVRLTALEKEFTERHNIWQASLQGKNDRLYQPLADSYAEGIRYYKILDTELFPVLDIAFKKGFVPGKLTSLGGAQPGQEEFLKAFDVYALKMIPAYDKHRASIDAIVNKLAVDLPNREAGATSLVRNRIGLLGFAAFAAMILSALLGFAVSRSIANPVDELTKAARNAAEDELPRIVAEVQNLPADAEIPSAKQVSVNSKDELGDLANALNSMQGTAISLAAEQARIRRNFSENLVNLGRRNQALLGRTLNLITQLETSERDSDKLDELFRLDHLTTRMRRNAESLLVLAGAEPTRMWSPPVEVGDVVRGALSEIEAYDRVDIQSIDPAELQGNSVNDVSHLLAELIENATTFSPPSTRVTVLGKQRGDGYLFVIMDDGVGMTHEDFELANRKISEVAAFDTTPSRVLGLSVVGRLCKRHGIQVKLTENVTNGVAARVLIPMNMLGSQRDELAVPSIDLPSRPASPVAEMQTSFPLPDYSFEDEPLDGASAPAALTNELDEHFGAPVSYNTTAYDTPSFETSPFDTPSYDATSYDTPSYDTPSYDTPSYDTPSYGLAQHDTTQFELNGSAVSAFDSPAHDAAAGYETGLYEPTDHENASEVRSYDAPAPGMDAAAEAPALDAPYLPSVFDADPGTPTPEHAATAWHVQPETNSADDAALATFGGRHTPDDIDNNADQGHNNLDYVTSHGPSHDVTNNGFDATSDGSDVGPVPVLAPADAAERPLTKRVRGAQMIDTGPEAIEDEQTERTPDVVRSALSSLQTGMQQGRQSEVIPTAAAPTARPVLMPVPAPVQSSASIPSPTVQPTALVTASAAPSSGLSRRVRGAQMIDTGPASDDEEPVTRDANDVRSMLASLQSGVQSAKSTLGDGGQ